MNTILFDLDGTLLPMDTKAFTDTYFKALTGRFAANGISPEKITGAVWKATSDIINNDGFLTNEDCFWNSFKIAMSDTDEPLTKAELKFFKKEIDKFYKKDFFVTRLNTYPTSVAKECINILKEKGYKLVVATNPIFPSIAIEQRIAWAGLDYEDFEFVTTMENSCFCKPNLNYYKKILQMMNLIADDCIMVGNDVYEDMCALKLGMDVFLIDECIINRHNEDVTEFKKGNWKVFREFVKELPYIR